MNPLSIGRRVAIAIVLVVAVALQTSFFSHLAWRGVVPDLVMLVVVAVALVRGPMPGMLLGFAGGLLLDLAPPADHVAGRWALALVLIGFLAGQFGPGPDGSAQRTGLAARTALVAGCSFVATSVVSLSGLVVDDLDYSFTDLLAVVLIALVLDVIASLVLLGPLTRLAGRTEETRRGAGGLGRGALSGLTVRGRR